MQGLITFLKKYWPTIVALANAIWVVLSPAYQAYIVAHPTAAGVIATIYAILTHFLPSPVSSFAPGPTKGSVMMVKANSAGK